MSNYLPSATFTAYKEALKYRTPISLDIANQVAHALKVSVSSILCNT